MRHQPVPDVTQADVDRVIARDFTAASHRGVREQLARLPAECGPRVALAVLKLARGDPADLPRHVDVARQDWRDVLVAAEYPADGLLSHSDPQDLHQAAYDADWQQYQAWLRARRSAR